MLVIRNKTNEWLGSSKTLNSKQIQNFVLKLENTKTLYVTAHCCCIQTEIEFLFTWEVTIYA